LRKKKQSKLWDGWAMYNKFPTSLYENQNTRIEINNRWE